MKSRTRIGQEQYDSTVQERPVPQCSNTKQVKMGYSDTNFFITNSGGESIWTDEVGPCHAVLIHGTPKSGPLGMVGLVHVSGDHDLIVSEAEKLLEEMEKTCDCEVYVVGGQEEWYSKGYTLDPERLGPKLGGKVKLLISPASTGNGFIRVELTGDRKINVQKLT